MAKEIILTTNAPAPIGPYSQAVKVGNTLYVSGQIPLNAQTGQLENESIEAETTCVMKNIEAVLAAAGFEFSDVVKSTIFITDMNQFSKINTVYGSYFTLNPPARETVQVARLPKDVNVEISVIAVKL
ncbi:MAG: RidA family protein [Chitinophagales bacterium]|nr:RidA family protein [Chitinophagales bacterium]OJV24116.1 MAG: reactive intermediate/imine deaminase [Bacteroidetes bacterium 37-13]HRN93595.1 RidA family protein [Chitinophagales bacterium]HRP39923.1 RidA family protein [Chitinophagales bacterium]